MWTLMKFLTFLNRKIGVFHSNLYPQTSISVNMYYKPLLKYMYVNIPSVGRKIEIGSRGVATHIMIHILVSSKD